TAPAPPATYTLSLHDALPICARSLSSQPARGPAIAGHKLRGHSGESARKRTLRSRTRRFHRRDRAANWKIRAVQSRHHFSGRNRSEEHTSELQSLAYLVCRLL